MQTGIVNRGAPARIFAGFLIAGALAFGLHCTSSNGSSSMTYYRQANLVSDQASGAPHMDANLLNPWGIAYGPSTGFLMGDNHSGVATEYDGNGVALPSSPLVITVPPPPGGTISAPTGVVYNGTGGFQGDLFIFATEDGTISGWSSGTSATLRVDHSSAGAVYKGLAIGAVGSANYIYATNFLGGTVEVFDTNYASVSLGSGAFVDPTLPSGFDPFGIQNIGGKIFVTYAERQGTNTDETAGPGLGYVSVFNADGTFVQRFASQGSLNAPWGLAMAPSGFGSFGGALLVGNFGDGHINAFNASTGAHMGALADGGGHPIAIDGLWGIAFGNGSSAGLANRLYFTAGPQAEAHGLFGDLQVIQTSSSGSGSGGSGY